MKRFQEHFNSTQRPALLVFLLLGLYFKWVCPEESLPPFWPSGTLSLQRSSFPKGLICHYFFGFEQKSLSDVTFSTFSFSDFVQSYNDGNEVAWRENEQVEPQAQVRRRVLLYLTLPRSHEPVV